ncbi:MAG: site-specific DNA-methyltransferase [Bacteroidetes bacterium]|nr:site-specific DNA-methyltransferase [Bacteroidota bacterium]
MKIIDEKRVTYFDEFKIERIVSEPSINYNLFEYELSQRLSEQIKIFSTLEKNLPLFNAESFGNQVHFQNAHKTPVQRWFPYREGYSTKLVHSFLDELNITGNVFDPFCGSGTTQLASRQKNLHSFGIDVNPISILVAEVENEFYNRKDIEDIEIYIREIDLVSHPEEIFKTKFELAKRVFNKDILQSLLNFKIIIEKIENQKVRKIFFAAWLAIIEKVSNVKKEGNGIKYKNRIRTPSGYINIDKEEWEENVFPEDKFKYVKNVLVAHLNVIFNDIKNHYGECDKPPKFFNGNCLNFTEYFKDDIQLTFYSPPYCNCFDYFEIHKVELWLGGFVDDKKEFKELRNNGFRSNTNSLNHKEIRYRNENIEALIELFDFEILWSKKIPNVVRGYFDDSYTLLKTLFDQTIPNGYIGIVVGNSAYTGVIIPTDIIIADIAKEIGYKVKDIFITRHLTTSSQQKIALNPLKDFLRESIILLQK